MNFVAVKSENKLTPHEKAFLDRNVPLLSHLSACPTQKCETPGCSELRRFLVHPKSCQTKIEGNCQDCINIFALAVHHDKRCNQDPNCKYSLCGRINSKYHVVPGTEKRD